MSRRSWSPTSILFRLRDGVICVSFESVDRFGVEEKHLEMNYVVRGNQRFLSMRPGQWERDGPAVSDLGEDLMKKIIAAMNASKELRSDR